MEKKQIFKKTILNWSANTKTSLFKKIAQYAELKNLVIAGQTLVEELYQRESMGDTLIEENLALPHIKSENVKQSSIIFIRLNDPIENWTRKGDQVYGILFLLVKCEEEKSNLYMIKEFTKLLADENVIFSLLQGDKNEIEKVLNISSE